MTATRAIRRQTVPGQELTTLPKHSATARLLDSEPTAMIPPSVSTRRQNSKFRDFLRHVRLLLPASFLGHTLPWKTTFEQRKVAVYQSRRMASLNSLLHVIPLAVAGTLLGLHWSRYWVGVSDDAPSLQFAAKVHELLMQASLVDVLLHVIRSQALNGYLPLGALAGAAQAPQLSYLWSLDFFSALVAPSRVFKARNKFVFILSTFTLLFMTGVVGPSSAVLMISRPGMTHVQSIIIRYLGISEADLFPTRIDKTNQLNFTLDADFYDTTRVDYKFDRSGPARSKNLWPTDLGSNVHRLLLSESPFYYSDSVGVPDGIIAELTTGKDRIIGDEWTIGTLPTMMSALQLWHHSSIAQVETVDEKIDQRETFLATGAQWTLQTSQPVVMSACSPVFYNTENISYPHVDGSTSILHNAAELYDTMLKMNANRTYFMSWIQLPQDPTSLLALFMDIDDRIGVYNGSDGSYSAPITSFTICTVSPFWWDTSTTLSLTSTDNLVQTEWPGSREDIVQDKSRPIIIDPEAIPKLHISPNQSHPNPSHNLAVTIVAGFAVALSWVPGQYIYSANRRIPLDTIEGLDFSSIIDPTSNTPLRIVKTITGYGYGSTDTSTLLSLAVIITYCFITVAYITYTIVTGHTSVAWNSATELILLALQSKEPDDLGHVSVGVDSTETLRRSVGIRVNTVTIPDTGERMQKLELVFEHDVQDKERILKKVERNQAY